MRLLPITASVAVAVVLAACTDATTVPRAGSTSGPARLTVCDPNSTGCSGPPPTTVNMLVEGSPYGINANELASDSTAQYPWGNQQDAGMANLGSMLASAGIGWVRLDVSWAGLQDPAGTDPCNPPPPNRNASTWNWAKLDRSMARAHNAGLNVLAVLSHTPASETSVRCDPHYDTYNPSDLSGWSNFVAAVADRYPYVHYWNVWNETNSAGFYRAVPGQSIPASYAALVNAAAPLLHQRGRLVVGVDAINSGVAPGILETQQYVHDVMASAGANIDVVSLHMYPGIDANAIGAVVQNTAATISAVVPNSAASGRIWLTEAGDDAYSAGDSAAYTNGVQGQHLNALLSAVTSASGSPSLEKAFYWSAYTDVAHSADSTNRGIIAGVFNNNPTPKPAYNAYQSFTGAHPPVAGVRYRAHVTGNGWMGWQRDLGTAGTTGQSRQMEAVQIIPNGAPTGMGIQYSAYVRGSGWQPWVTAGQVAGTTGQGLAMDGVRFQLVNAPSGYHICYTAHISVYGWQSTTCDGTIAGRPGSNLSIEALTVQISP